MVEVPFIIMRPSRPARLALLPPRERRYNGLILTVKQMGR
jgi:hypothetical protein